MTVANSKRKSTQLLLSLNLTALNPSSYFIPITMSDLHSEGDQYKHGSEIDRDHRFKVVVLIVVGAEADDVEDGGGDKDVGRYPKQLSTKDQANLNCFNTVPLLFNLCGRVERSSLSSQNSLPTFIFSCMIWYFCS